METVVNIILHVIFIAVFINIFFFTYGSHIEEEAVKSQLKYIVDGTVDDMKILYPEFVQFVRPSVMALESPDLQESDKFVEDNNESLKQKAIISTLVLFLVGIFTSVILMYHYKLNYGKLLLSNFISLSFVGILYFLFSTFVIAKYQSVDNNFIKKTILKSLQ
jgi:hypothetical protein